MYLNEKRDKRTSLNGKTKINLQRWIAWTHTIKLRKIKNNYTRKYQYLF